MTSEKLNIEYSSEEETKLKDHDDQLVFEDWSNVHPYLQKFDTLKT